MLGIFLHVNLDTGESSEAFLVSQVFRCLGDGAAQSRLHNLVLHLPLPGPPGSTGHVVRVLCALPVRYLSGHP